MLFEGCQGKPGVTILEKKCPNCGNLVELMSTDAVVECEECGYPVYTDLMDCAYQCPKAKKCLGDAQYARMCAVRAQWEAQMKQLRNDDEW